MSTTAHLPGEWNRARGPLSRRDKCSKFEREWISLLDLITISPTEVLMSAVTTLKNDEQDFDNDGDGGGKGKIAAAGGKCIKICLPGK